jgi:hypothetical protein
VKEFVSIPDDDDKWLLKALAAKISPGTEEIVRVPGALKWVLAEPITSG